MSQINAIDLAYHILEENNGPQSFLSLWNNIVEQLGYDEKIAKSKKVKLYSAMMLDPRFVSLKENMWDVAERVKFEQKHIDTSESELDDEDEEIEDDDLIVESDETDYDNPNRNKRNEDDDDLI